MDNEKMPAGLGCNEGLGPLPEPDWWLNKPHGAQYYTADQMRSYAAQEKAAERERCARKLALADYLIGAFERGADVSEYGRDIAEFRA